MKTPLKPSVIVCAAIRSRLTGRILCGARHFDSVMRKFVTDRIMRDEWLSAEQGFIDQYGTFLTREQAYEIAKNNGQLASHLARYPLSRTAGRLYSEDLY